MAPISPPLTGASSIAAPRLRGFARETARRVRRDRAHVDDDAVRLERAEDAGRLLRGPARHPDRPAASSRCVRAWRATSAGDDRPRRAGADDLVDWSLTAAVYDERELLLEKIARHGPAHDAEADESDALCHGPTITRRPSRWPVLLSRYRLRAVLRDVPRGLLAARAFDVDFAGRERAVALRFAPRGFAAAVLRGVVDRAVDLRAVRAALLARLAVGFVALTRFCPAREPLAAAVGRRFADSEVTTRGSGVASSGASPLRPHAPTARRVRQARDSRSPGEASMAASASSCRTCRCCVAWCAPAPDRRATDGRPSCSGRG